MKLYKNSFTLVELLVVLGIIGVGIAIFYSIFFINWFAYEMELTLIYLQEQADRIFTVLEQDIMEATQFTLADNHNVTIFYPDSFVPPRPDVSYSINDITGDLIRTEEDTSVTLSSDLDSSSIFQQGNWDSFIFNLTLAHGVLGRNISFATEREISFRN